MTSALEDNPGDGTFWRNMREAASQRFAYVPDVVSRAATARPYADFIPGLGGGGTLAIHSRHLVDGPMRRWVVVAALLMLVMGTALPAWQPTIADLTGPMRLLPD